MSQQHPDDDDDDHNNDDNDKVDDDTESGRKFTLLSAEFSKFTHCVPIHLSTEFKYGILLCNCCIS